jgi:hypothetical protein
VSSLMLVTSGPLFSNCHFGSDTAKRKRPPSHLSKIAAPRCRTSFRTTAGEYLVRDRQFSV